MHIKRKTIPKFWPIARTGNKYLAVPSHNKNEALPLVIVMRELLGLVKTKKELKKVLNEKKVLVNGKIVQETNYPISLFDSLAIPSINKYFRIVLAAKKLSLIPITEKEINTGLFKVINKILVAKGKTQLNLSNGRNMITSEKIQVGNFVAVDNIKNKIIKIIPLEKDTKVIVIKGKHMGESGKIKEIVKEGQNNIAKIKADNGEISTEINNLFAEL
jgi:small subunit ribosomal protein S4e